MFGLADHAAMLAVNHPHVVLGSATSKFLKPVRVGETVVATATRTSEAGKRHVVAVEVLGLVGLQDPVQAGRLWAAARHPVEVGTHPSAAVNVAGTSMSATARFSSK